MALKITFDYNQTAIIIEDPERKSAIAREVLETCRLRAAAVAACECLADAVDARMVEVAEVVVARLPLWVAETEGGGVGEVAVVNPDAHALSEFIGVVEEVEMPRPLCEGEVAEFAEPC